MFRANLKCEVAYMGATDIYGKRTYGAWSWVKFGVVKLEQGSKHTSVRTDASGSRSYAHEIVTDARFLFHKDVVLQPGDRIRFLGFLLTVVSVFPRHRVTGEFDHWQIDANIWAG